MGRHDDAVSRGLAALRAAVLETLAESLDVLAATAGPQPVHALTGAAATSTGRDHGRLLAAAEPLYDAPEPPVPPAYGDAELALSSEECEEERTRLIALVELARNGDKEAFGLLYDHYQPSVYRFLYYRTRSASLAEDLTSDTFFRALRSMSSFRWQGRDFGAWLMTIARNLTTDHFKAGRTRLEMTTDDMSAHDDTTESPETAVLAGLTNEILMDALKRLPTEQQECLVMRFLQGMSIAETAAVLGRSEGAVKQLQLRAVRSLARLMPTGLRDA